MTDAEINWYVATGEPLDKAGAYGLQYIGGCFVARLNGNAQNVIGLPVHAVLRLAAQLGVDLLG
jgi:septum formation protein